HLGEVRHRAGVVVRARAKRVRLVVGADAEHQPEGERRHAHRRGGHADAAGRVPGRLLDRSLAQRRHVGVERRITRLARTGLRLGRTGFRGAPLCSRRFCGGGSFFRGGWGAALDDGLLRVAYAAELRLALADELGPPRDLVAVDLDAGLEALEVDLLHLLARDVEADAGDERERVAGQLD